jgi:hypothetical protein
MMALLVQLPSNAAPVFWVGLIGLIVAYFIIRSDRRADRRQKKAVPANSLHRLSAAAMAFVMSARMLDDVPLPICMESYLREWCGYFWIECGIAIGCWIVYPG